MLPGVAQMYDAEKTAYVPLGFFMSSVSLWLEWRYIYPSALSARSTPCTASRPDPFRSALDAGGRYGAPIPVRPWRVFRCGDRQPRPAWPAMRSSGAQSMRFRRPVTIWRVWQQPRRSKQTSVPEQTIGTTGARPEGSPADHSAHRRQRGLTSSRVSGRRGRPANPPRCWWSCRAFAPGRRTRPSLICRASAGNGFAADSGRRGPGVWRAVAVIW